MSNWLTYSPTSGHGNGTITITADTLSILEDRVATIIASNSQYSLSASTSVTQKGVPPTAITFENLTWVTDIPASGGTATKDNCSYKVYAKYSDSTFLDITSAATVTGSLNVPSSTATTRHSAGTLTLTASYSGFTDSDSVDVYQERYRNDYSKEYLTFDIISSGTIYWKATGNSEKTISYSKDNGITWTDIASSTGGTQISVNLGDIIKFKGDNALYNGNKFIASTSVTFTVEGNIMSLIDSAGFATATTLTSAYTFASFFADCAGLTSAENLVLPATTLADGCYAGMFQGCASLATAPELPANTLSSWCYMGMFEGCTSLTQAPELPATTLAQYCYRNMFQGCTSLATAPELPATTLANGCYIQMFQSCTSLTAAPELPATTLADWCYGSMFKGCSSLTTPPELPATTLAPYCYESMFYRCTSLNYIKCLATDISANNCVRYWVFEVASTGTFIKNPNMSNWQTGDSGIPSGWTVTNAS